jgi:hypothetical protein
MRKGLLLLAPFLLPAQEPAVPTLGELMHRLRSPESDWLAREEAVELIVAHHGQEGAKQAVRYALERLESDGARWLKARKRYLRHFEKSAPEAVGARFVKESDEQIARLRTEALAISAREPLEAQHITEEVDPKLARLGELLLVAPAAVLARDAELAREQQELVFALDGLRDWWEVWRLAADGWIALNAEAAGAGAGATQEPPPHPDPLQDEVDLAEEWLCVLATPMTERDRETLLANHAGRALILAEEYAGILFHNLIRIQLGLHAQRTDPKLCEAGRDHSKDMQELGFFAHESPVPGKKGPGDRAARFGTSAGAENIAWGMDTPRGAILAWWHSPGHHKNMLGGADRIGLGCFANFWTEMFG